MKLLRIIMLNLLLVLLAGSLTVVAVLLHNQTWLVNQVLGYINTATGIRIVAPRSRLRFLPRLTVILDHPTVLKDGREFLRVNEIRAVVRYHRLIHQNGMPLYALIFDEPMIQVPGGSAAWGALPAPPDEDQIRAGLMALRQLMQVTDRLRILDATLIRAGSTTPLVTDLYVRAGAAFLRPTTWFANVSAPVPLAPFGTLDLQARLSVELTDPVAASDVVAQGSVTFRNATLSALGVEALKARGTFGGRLELSLHAGGRVDGAAHIDAYELELAGKTLKKPLALGDCGFDAFYSLSATSLAVTKLVVARAGTQLAGGSISVDDPFSPAAHLTLQGSAVGVDLADLKKGLAELNRVPAELSELAGLVTGGELLVNQVSLDAPLPASAWTSASLRDGLRAIVALNDVRLAPPASSAVAPVSALGAQVIYERGRLRISQGSAVIGRSTLESFNGEADFARGLGNVPYKATATGDLDLAELYAALRASAPAALPAKLKERLTNLGGHGVVQLSAGGTVKDRRLAIPASYLATIDTSHATLAVRGFPSELALVGGRVTVDPARLTIDRVIARPPPPQTGNFMLSGGFRRAAGTLEMTSVNLELHQIKIDSWLPLIVSPDDLAAQGVVGGKLSLRPDGARPNAYVANAKFTMGQGKIQFSFLRSPMLVASADLTLDGKTLKLGIPASTFEGQPLRFNLAVADVYNPEVEIDAVSRRLDFEAIRAVRMPWSKSPPPVPFPFPVFGHIEAADANFGKLLLSNTSADFERRRGIWRIYNFKADSLHGKADLTVDGRTAPEDNWINIKGKVTGMDVGPLFLLPDPHRQVPLTGALEADADLRANADTDFFDTMGGKVSVHLTNGTLNRFTLLARILALIDLKTWFSARIPDPRLHGVPFNSITGTFAATKGTFHTDDLRLQGPVMNMAAQGDIQVGANYVDMQIGVIPFNSVSWVMDKIPLIGPNMALSAGSILAAYFQVKGPVDNPSVRPKPITSVAEFVAKTLGLPINIIRPDTIK